MEPSLLVTKVAKSKEELAILSFKLLAAEPLLSSEEIFIVLKSSTIFLMLEDFLAELDIFVGFFAGAIFGPLFSSVVLARMPDFFTVLKHQYLLLFIS